jgi:hypothetical protein
VEFNGSHSKEVKDYWTYLEENYKEVASWPAWMRGETTTLTQKAATAKEDLRDKQDAEQGNP